MASSPLDPNFGSGDDQVGGQAEDHWSGPGVPDEPIVNGFTNMQAVDQQYADTQPVEQTFTAEPDMEAGISDAQSNLTMENSMHRSGPTGHDLVKGLGKGKYHHPSRWLPVMERRLRIREENNISPAKLLEDLQPQWFDKHPPFLDTMTAGGQSRIATYERAKFRPKLSRDAPHALERAVRSMCARWLTDFNKPHELTRYQSW